MNSTKTRLLLCSSSMDGGGSEKQLLYLLQNLPRDRFDIVLYLLYRTGSLLPEVPEDVKIHAYWDGRKYPRINWPGRILASQIEHLKQVIQSERIEVVYDRLYHMTMLTAPSTANGRIGRASTIVSPPSQDLVRNERRWLPQKKARLKQAYATADALLCVDDGTADDASKFYEIDRQRFQVIRSPIDLARIDHLSEQPAERMERGDSVKHIVSVGRLSEEKGHRYLIQAVGYYLSKCQAERMPEVVLHLIGDGVLRKELESLTNSLGLQDSVIFHGQQANPLAFVKRCDLFVLPSLYEGFPNSVLEAMACEVPIIATARAGGVAPLFEQIGVGKIVAAANADELATAVKAHFRAPEVLASTAPIARQYVSEHHELRGWVSQLSDLLGDLRR